MAVRSPSFGIHLNNRAPLLSEAYGVDHLVELTALAEELGFDSAWVGDGLVAQPRHDPLTLLAALSQETTTVRLGTACLRLPLRDPLYLAMAWATLDQLCGGRTILGACSGNAAEASVRQEFEMKGLDWRRRARRLEEVVDVLRQLWTSGRATLRGQHFSYEDVAFSSGTEVRALQPLQTPPPIWIVSNPRVGGADPEATRPALERAVRRIVRLGNGWMTCCRATHPEEVEEQATALRDVAREQGIDPRTYTIAYQVTVAVAGSRQQASKAFREYIAANYPEFGPHMDLSDWGPIGTPDDVGEWFESFTAAGVDHFIVRFGSVDRGHQIEELRRFAADVIPRVRAEITSAR